MYVYRVGINERYVNHFEVLSEVPLTEHQAKMKAIHLRERADELELEYVDDLPMEYWQVDEV